MEETKDFAWALLMLQQGLAVTRKGWNGAGMFVFMQVPSTISEDVVPNMTSLPPAIKNIFMNRGGALKYSNQFALVKPDNTINGWAPSVSDTLAKDWELY